MKNKNIDKKIARLLNTDEGKQKLRKSIIQASDNISEKYRGSSLGYTAAAFSHIMKSVDAGEILPINY